MASLVTCAGKDVLRGRVHLGLVGAWWAELVLDSGDPPSGAQSIAAADGLSIAGIVTASGVSLVEASHVRLVGGAGGLGKDASGAWQSAALSDPLRAILDAAGEKISATVGSDLLALELPAWNIITQPASRALDELAGFAAAAIGAPVHWRVLADGSIWMGAEAWPAASLPVGADVLEVFPAEGRYVIGASTPALLPGVNLDGVGQVRAVDHWIEPQRVRSVAWI